MKRLLALAPHLLALAPHAALLVAVGGLVLSILRANGGHFAYTLDDPYIHLALSENLAHGHLGIEPDAASAPSSSVVWPLLLAPFAGTSFHDLVPLAINTLALLLCAHLLDLLLRELGLVDTPRARLLRAGLVVGVLVVLNGVGVVFTGMEHSLSCVFAVATALGLARLQRTGRLGAWLVAGIVLGPLVRYENLVFSGGALLALVIHGRWRAGLGLGAAMVAPLAAFSLYLVSQGLAWLPSSVRTKSAVVTGDSTNALLDALSNNVHIAAANDQGRALLALGALFLLAPLLDRTRATLAAATAGLVAVAGHVLGGRYGWFGRYEVYALIGGTALLFLAHRRTLALVARRLPAALGWALVLGPLALATPGLLKTTRRTPEAASEIYRQQFQLHRLARAWDRPLALNDVGWASFRNPSPILDVYGLCDDAVRAQRLGDDPTWLGRLLDEREVRAAALFEHPSPPWFADVIPDTWTRVGELRLAGWRVLKAPVVVGVYATRAEEVPALTEALRSIAAGVPDRVKVVLASPAGGTSPH